MLFDAGGVVNDGRIALGPSTLLAASLNGIGSVTIDAGSTLAVQGTVAAGETIVFAGIGGVLDLGDPAGMAGTIVGYVSGDEINTGPQTVSNNGTITGANQCGVVLATGGLVTNAASASIAGSYAGVFIFGGAGTVANDGSIAGGSVGVKLAAGGTLTSAGTIIGKSGTAVEFGGGGPGLLVLEPGFAITGAVSGSTGVSDTLVLASAASAGVLTGLGTKFVNFGSIVLDAGATWAISGTVTVGQSLVSAGDVTGATIDGGRLVVAAGAAVAATGAGGLTIAGGTISNAGTMPAANGSPLAFQSAVVNTNNAGGVLTGGTWEADGNGASLSLTGGAVAHDLATIILSGAGSVFRAGDGSSFTNLEASLRGINPYGTLELLAGRSFSATNGISDFGMIQLAGGTLTLPGLALAGGHVRGFGRNADTRFALSNAGTIEANGGTLAIAGVVGGGGSLVVDAGAALATGLGVLTIAGGTVSNAGAMLAANGSTLTLQSAVVNTNNAGGVLSGGTWEASGSGSTLAVTGGAVTQDKATIILSGAGSAFSAGAGSAFTNLEASLVGVAPIGVLELLAGRSFAATHAIGDFGMIQLAGGTLTLPLLAVGAGGHVSGFGTIADTRYPISNAGTIEANGGKLAIATAIDPASTGVFRLDATSFLEIAADQGADELPPYRRRTDHRCGAKVRAERRQRGGYGAAGAEFRHRRSYPAEERRAGGTEAGVRHGDRDIAAQQRFGKYRDPDVRQDNAGRGRVPPGRRRPRARAADAFVSAARAARATRDANAGTAPVR